MSADVMSVRLHLRGVRVTEVVVNTPSELIVGVVSTKKLSQCPHCGRSCRRVHDRRQRKIRDLEISGRRTVLLWTRRRYVCDGCGRRHMETHPQFLGGYDPPAGAQAGPRRPGDAHPGGVPPAPDQLASDHGPGHRLVRSSYRLGDAVRSVGCC